MFLFLLVGLAAIAAAVAALFFFLDPRGEGGTETETYRVGVLNGVAFFSPSLDGFQEQMAALGYQEGIDIVYDVRSTEVDFDQYRAVATQFVEEDVDLLLVFATEATIITKEVTEGTGIPVVFTVAGVEGNDLVNSISSPGGNITGVHYPEVAGLALLRLELLSQLLPDARRIAVFDFPWYPIVEPQLEALRTAAQSLGIEIVEVPLEDPEEIQAELAAWAATPAAADIDAVLMTDGVAAVTPPTYDAIARFAAERNIPFGGMPFATGASPEYQPLFYVLIDIPEAGRQAAVLADKILRGGMQAGTIPLPSAETFIELNARVADTWGIVIPPGLLERANRIVR